MIGKDAIRALPGWTARPVRPDLTRLVGTIEGWIERRRQRRALLQLNDHMLKDIGVSRADAWREGAKPFWRD